MNLYMNEKKQSILRQKTIPKPYYTKVENGIVLPCKIKDTASGGVCDSKGNIVTDSIYDGGWMKRGGKYKYDRQDILKKDEKVIFLGFFVKHWGHFIIDCMNKFWILNEKDLGEYKICYLDDGEHYLDGNYLEFLRLLGIKENQLLEIKKITMFREIIVPSDGKVKNNYSIEFKNIFKIAVKNALLMNTDYKKVPQKIYFSRQLFQNAQKKEIGEEDIEKIFKDNGYTILYPERLTLIEQIICFQKAKEIVCLNGSIPLNAVFASDDVQLVVINKTSLKHENLLFVTGMMKINPVYVDAYYEPIKNHPRYLGEGPFWLEVNDNVQNYLVDQNVNAVIFKSNRNIKKYFIYYKIYAQNRIIRFLRKMKRLLVTKK